MDIINEKDSYFFTASFLDENKAPVTPNSGTWRIDDVTGGVETEIKVATTFTPTAATHDFEVVPNENRILTATNQSEIRRATVTMIYGTSKQKTKEYEWTVKNVSKIT